MTIISEDIIEPFLELLVVLVSCSDIHIVHVKKVIV